HVVDAVIVAVQVAAVRHAVTIGVHRAVAFAAVRDAVIVVVQVGAVGYPVAIAIDLGLLGEGEELSVGEVDTGRQGASICHEGNQGIGAIKGRIIADDEPAQVGAAQAQGAGGDTHANGTDGPALLYLPDAGHARHIGRITHRRGDGGTAIVVTPHLEGL